MRTCEVKDCGARHLARGMCQNHYARWRAASVPTKVCLVEGCSRRHSAHGYCDSHARNYRKFGTPIAPLWRQDEVGYAGAHYRVRLEKGVASTQTCQHCAGPAQEWAYDHEDGAQLTYLSPKGPIAYSVDPKHYFALCKPCHTRFDRDQSSRLASA
jgi:hypothetical protein